MAPTAPPRPAAATEASGSGHNFTEEQRKLHERMAKMCLSHGMPDKPPPMRKSQEGMEVDSVGDGPGFTDPFFDCNFDEAEGNAEKPLDEDSFGERNDGHG